MNFWITGDIHRSLEKFKYLTYKFKQNPDNAMIILGDVGWNYFLDERDEQLKAAITRKYKMRFYCLRGNHEARPQDIPGMQLVYDDDVKGEVYIEQDYPNIRYFKDFGEYIINGFTCLCIGGAYSVDKYYRLASGFGWFENEQLNQDEMNQCLDMCQGKSYDFVLTHTCPYQFRPTDMFLETIPQETVDNSMEIFLENIRKHITYKVWLFGHYHADRIERPHVEMFYNNKEPMENIYRRWEDYEINKQLDWHLLKSPNFWMGNDDFLKETLDD